MTRPDSPPHGNSQISSDHKRNRQRRPTERRLLTGIYWDADRLLFVPSLMMFDVREHVRQRRGDGARSERALLKKAPAGRSAVASWLELFRGQVWFRPWLMDGIEPPPDVHVPSKSEVRRMLTICSYSRMMTGISPRGGKEYSRYIGKGPRFGFPVESFAAWLRWLYGGSPPEGWIVVEPLALAVRDQLTREAICTAAGVSVPTYTKWKADEDCRLALTAAVSRRIAGGKEPVNCEAWRNLRSRSNAFNAGKREMAMLKWAAEATERRALERAKKSDLSLSGDLSDLRRLATDAGVIDSLNQYIAEFLERLPDRPTTDRKKGVWFRRGAVAPGIFAPLPWMQEFRRRATKAWNELQIGAVERNAGKRLFELWFLDWAIPLEVRRSKWVRMYRARVGLIRPDSRSPWRTTAGTGADQNNAAPPPTEPGRIDHERLSAALEKVGSAAKYSQQRKLVKATAELTAGKPKHWALAKAIARRAGIANNTNVSVALNKLADRGALRKKPSGKGYRLPVNL